MWGDVGRHEATSEWVGTSRMRCVDLRGSSIDTSLKLSTSFASSTSGPMASPVHSIGTVLPPGVRTS